MASSGGCDSTQNQDGSWLPVVVAATVRMPHSSSTVGTFAEISKHFCEA